VIYCESVTDLDELQELMANMHNKRETVFSLIDWDSMDVQNDARMPRAELRKSGFNPANNQVSYLKNLIVWEVKEIQKVNYLYYVFTLVYTICLWDKQLLYSISIITYVFVHCNLCHCLDVTTLYTCYLNFCMYIFFKKNFVDTLQKQNETI